MHQTGMRCRPSQKARLHESVKVEGVSTCRGMTKHVQIPGKSTKLIFILGLQYSACTLTEVSLPLCLSPHDASPTYTYLHCPMRLSRLGNLFV
jgi:hypothetical protein